MVRERELCWIGKWCPVLSKLPCVSMFTTIAPTRTPLPLLHPEQDSMSMIRLLGWSGHTHVHNVPHTFTYYETSIYEHTMSSCCTHPYHHTTYPFWGVMHAEYTRSQCERLDLHPHSYKEQLSITDSSCLRLMGYKATTTMYQVYT